MHTAAIRSPMVEVLRCEFSGTAIIGGKHIVTVEMGEPFERCAIKIDGNPFAYKSWTRCRSLILRRVFAGLCDCQQKGETK